MVGSEDGFGKGALPEPVTHWPGWWRERQCQSFPSKAGSLLLLPVPVVPVDFRNGRELLFVALRGRCQRAPAKPLVWV